MSEDKCIAYVYRHRKFGTTSTFYIGMGHSSKFLRSRELRGRSNGWKEVVLESNGKFEVDILASGLTWEDAAELETLLIEEYGRACYGTGCLVNIRKGGEGTKGFPQTEEHKRLLSERMRTEENPMKKNRKFGESNNFYGKKHNEEARARMKENHADFKCSNSTSSKRIINTQTEDTFECVGELSAETGIARTTLTSYLNGNSKNPTYFMYYEDFLKYGARVPDTYTARKKK